MKLQIGFLTERLILGFGVDLAVHQYASYLQGQGHDVTVFCERHEPIVERKYRVIDLGGSRPHRIYAAQYCQLCKVLQ